MELIQQTNAIKKALAKYFHPAKINAKVSAYGDFILIEPSTRGRKDLEGLQIIYFDKDQVFEFSEYQAGTGANELHVFGTYKTINAVLRRFLKGKCKPVKIWN